MAERDLSAESTLIHAGTDRSLGAPAVPPLVPASIFVSWGDPESTRAYGRNGNPTWEALEQALGATEQAEAVAFASGQAASRFGGVESTWERRARWAAETAPETLIRLSVGIEPVADLIADIDASLEAAW
jgi:cystathionine beta-lyase/cystathionine gamma-synthase